MANTDTQVAGGQVETREAEDFSALLKQSFKPRTERAATEVENAVAGQVTGGDRDRILPDGIDELGLKGPITIAQQHRNGVRAPVGDGQVETPVAVEVAGGDGLVVRVFVGVLPDGGEQRSLE